jgi:flagellar basal-body rod protein FlgC
MGLFSGLNIASSALSVQRLRMDVISNNIANAETTRTPEGGAFQRSRVVLRPIVNQPYWRSPFLPPEMYNGTGRGVQAVRIEKDKSSPVLKYDPTHPDRIMSGPNKDYVEMPNVKVVDEMVDLISASRAYEANVTLVESHKNAFMKALEIAR